jgi:demethylmenaquinone methyltransferase/2-methoxy-6-polyprenyl-1,4-benzoquinol methylase
MQGDVNTKYEPLVQTKHGRKARAFDADTVLRSTRARRGERRGERRVRDRPYAERLELAGRVTRPAIAQAMDAFAPQPGSLGLDAGCGIGGHTLLLSARVGPGGKVTGLDRAAAHLDVARARADASGGGPVEFVCADMLHMPFGPASFDWVWCADSLWPVFVADEPAEAVRELARVVRPGGTVALVYWSGQCLLPGHPVLEARLNAAFAAKLPYLARVAPHDHFMRARGWMSRAGLAHARARSFVAELAAPVESHLREGLAYCFAMLWGELDADVSREDWGAYRRLCDPASPAFVADQPDYYAFVTYTLFVGTKPS